MGLLMACHFPGVAYFILFTWLLLGLLCKGLPVVLRDRTLIVELISSLIYASLFSLVSFTHFVSLALHQRPTYLSLMN